MIENVSDKFFFFVFTMVIAVALFFFGTYFYSSFKRIYDKPKTKHDALTRMNNE